MNFVSVTWLQRRAANLLATMAVFCLLAGNAFASALYTGTVASDVPSASFGFSQITRAVGAGTDGTIYVGFFSADGTQLRLAKSIDRGATFSTSVLVDTAATGRTFATASLGVSSSGTVVLAYEDSSANVFSAYSSNSGAGFTLATGLNSTAELINGGVQVQTRGTYVYVGFIVTGGVAVATSSDGGATFSAPVSVTITGGFFGLLVDQSNGDVIVGAEEVTLSVRVSHDHGATFDPEQNPAGQVFFSNWTISSDESGRYLWVGGTDLGPGDPVYQIDLSNGTSTARTAFFSTTSMQTRSMYAAGCGEVVDSVAGSVAVSHDFGTTLGTTHGVNGTNQTTFVNPSTGDVLVAYQNGSATQLDVYEDEVTGCAAKLTLAVSDGHDFARYGQTLNYLVTASNVGYLAADNASVGLSTSGSGLNLANATWYCVGSDNTAICPSSSGTGASLGTVTLQPHTSMTWIVSVPVLASTTDDTIELDANATNATSASDVDTLAIFRGSFDVIHSDGTNALP